MTTFKIKKISLIGTLSILLLGCASHAMSTSELIDQLCQATLTCKDLSEIKRLLDAGANVNGQSGAHGTTPLYNACQVGNETAVIFLVNEGALIDGLTDDGYTPLHAAVLNDHIAIVHLLLSLGAPVDQGDMFFKKTPLHFAAIRGNIRIVQKLLAKGASINAEDIFGRTPLSCAAQEKVAHVLKIAGELELNT